jgi:hypothetical protein
MEIVLDGRQHGRSVAQFRPPHKNWLEVGLPISDAAVSNRPFHARLSGLADVSSHPK